MILSAIVAIGERGVIGVGNKLPWHLASDLKRFKEITMGKPVIMGDKTHESIGAILPGRLNIVISSNTDYAVIPGAILTRSLDDAIKRAEESGAEEAFIIGGAYTYAQALPRCDKLYVTRVVVDLPNGDKFFPDINLAEWDRVSIENGVKTENDDYDFFFEIYKRRYAN